MEHFVIVGGTTGSGRTLVRMLSDRGSRVSLLGLKPSPEAEHCPGVHFHPVNLQDLRGTAAAIDECVVCGGRARITWCSIIVTVADRTLGRVNSASVLRQRARSSTSARNRSRVALTTPWW